jgi:two-component system sensor histidine kinase and response regulator WspE
MSQENTPDLSQMSMLDLFRMEAEAQAQTLVDGLLALERRTASASTLESMMRAAHSIKGAASIVGLAALVQLAHAMEDTFIAAQSGQLELGPARVDLLLRGVDLLAQAARIDGNALPGWMVEQALEITSTIDAIRDIANQPDAPAAAAPDAPPMAGNIAFPPSQAEAPQLRPMEQASRELLALASEARMHAHQVQPIVQSLYRFKRNQGSLYAALESLHEALLQSGDSTLIEKSSLALQRTAPLKQFLVDHVNTMESFDRRATRNARALVDEVIAMRMRPIRDGVHGFPRMVRDLARTLGKEVMLEIDGEDTLVDRDILARIESPLNHILRNAVDHGIEDPAERVRAGKPARGTIRLEARHRAGMLSIEISDDGRGVDLTAIRAAVVARGLSSPAMTAAMTPAELMEFLFLPAFSLKQVPNELSGRGVGLDLVQAAIREQNGAVKMDTEPGKGFRTSITLPLTQSLVRSLVLEIAGEAYAVPIVKIERVLRVPANDIRTLENKQYIEYNGEHLGLVQAAQALDLGEQAPPGEELALVVIGSAARRHALLVDRILGEQSLAVQELDSIFGKVRDISAAALLDDGTPVLLLDVSDLMISIDKLLDTGGLRKLERGASSAGQKAKRVLVVDDSLTVREMERKLLLARGYDVDIAVDGVDGWNIVRSGEYDLVITDVDMPRMDGIELVGLIKKHPALHALPVMIVSYKDRAEDRSRGLSAGADYYLTKGSFHDETLLEAVHDLIGAARP